MNEQIDQPYFSGVSEEVEEVSSNGECNECIGTGYVMVPKDNLIGVLFTSTVDSDGKTGRRLIRCPCKVDVTY